jgi:hypothetical protein
MKKSILFVFMTAALITIQNISLSAQTVSTFENLSLAPASYWNGSNMPMGASFTSGNAIFPNVYDTAYGGFWSAGWAYSNMQDSTSAGFMNLYSARPAIGYGNSSNYAVGQQGSLIKLSEEAAGKAIHGFYVTNGTYAAISMRDGDLYGKKFGGDSGNDPDWFKLTVRKWHNGEMTDDSVECYLADFRFEDNALDYIVTNWQWVDLTSLGNVDSLKFILSSSDVGPWGMNTPAFFCIDNFTTTDFYAAIQDGFLNNSLISVYPNPVENRFTVDLSALPKTNYEVNAFDLTGKLVFTGKSGSSEKPAFDISKLAPGAYFIKIIGANSVYTKTVIKKLP